MYRTTRRFGVQAHVYANNPWALVRTGIVNSCPTGATREALAYVEQSEYFFDAASHAREWAAKPLLTYYSFMNLAKAFVLARGIRATLDQAQHGVSERLRPSGRELVDAYLQVFPSPGSRGPNLLADFWHAITGVALSAQIALDVPHLLPQIVAGHRLWCEAANAAERFIGIENIHIMQAPRAKQIWLVLHVHSGTLSRLGIAQKDALAGAQLAGLYRAIDSIPSALPGEEMLRFEQIKPLTYSHRASDSIPELVHGLRTLLWAAATTVRPFREYYLYASPVAERAAVVPQLISMYGIAYYLGSITRYRPQHFGAIMQSEFGGQMQEFLTTQPMQFAYLLASDFLRRDVTRPSLV